MKAIKFFFLFTLIFVFNYHLSAQKRNCGTMHYLEQEMKKDPSLAQKMYNNEINLQNWIKN